jgi:hypothetical protein
MGKLIECCQTIDPKFSLYNYTKLFYLSLNPLHTHDPDDFYARFFFFLTKLDRHRIPQNK